MSTYLLLRNNKQTGPFTIEEIKRLSLKSYDLVWIEGKSAAWRYPGEITEFKTFAPPAPEQPFDRFYKKNIPESTLKEIKAKQAESLNGKQNSFPDLAHADLEEAHPDDSAGANRESIYINLPASETNLHNFAPASSVQNAVGLNEEEPLKYPDHFKMPDKSRPAAKKGLLIGSILLLFGAGMFTGFFISNRRSFYSKDGIPPHELNQPVKTRIVPQTNINQNGISGSNENKEQDNKEPAGPLESNTSSRSKSRKKSGVSSSAGKDSLHTAALPAPVLKNKPDSAQIRQEAENKKIALAAKIEAHPETYLLVNTGKFKVGVLGGISVVPVTLTNRSGVRMDLVVVAVDYIQRNKKIFKTENLSFHDLAPGTTVTEEAPKSSRGVKINYRLVIANSQQMGISYSNLN